MVGKPAKAGRETTTDPILQLGAVELRDRLAKGALRAVELATACADRIAAREETIQAWAWFDSEHVLRQAEALDRHRAAGRTIGPLHGLPVRPGRQRDAAPARQQGVGCPQDRRVIIADQDSGPGKIGR